MGGGNREKGVYKISRTQKCATFAPCLKKITFFIPEVHFPKSIGSIFYISASLGWGGEVVEGEVGVVGKNFFFFFRDPYLYM